MSLLAAAAWLLAAARATGVRPADRGLPYDAERIGMLTLVVVVLVFAVHSAVDWTWFVPANAGVAMLCAGWVVGRGPLRVAARAPGGPARPGGAAVAARRAGSRGSASGCRRCARSPSARVIAIALAAAWTAFQPVRAVHAGDAAFDRLDQGQPEAAAVDRAHRHRAQPAVGRPAVRARRDRGGARAHARRPRPRSSARSSSQPANAETWRRLGRLRLSTLNDPKGALSAFQAAYYLDPQQPGVDLGRDRGQPRRRYGRRARAVRPVRRSGAPPRRARARRRSRRARSVAASERRV